MKAKQEENGFVNVSLTKLEVLELAQDLIKMALSDERVNVELIEGTGVMIPPSPVSRVVDIEGSNSSRLVFFNLVHQPKAEPAPVPVIEGQFPWTIQHLKHVLEHKWPADVDCWSKATAEIRDMSLWAREQRGLGERHATDFRGIHSPSGWNQAGVRSVVEHYSQMTTHQRIAFCERFKEWLLEWEALLSQ